jgi:hypothetical protein
MKKMEELIRKYEDSCLDDNAVYIKTRLKMINGIFGQIKGSEEQIYMEEIISKFAEIVECQYETILEAEIAAAAADGYGPPQTNWVPHHNGATRWLTADEIPWDPEREPEEVEKENNVPSCLPPEGGFQTDEQVRKAFTNYLTYHVVRKTKAGKEKPFSVHTIYDYSSRIKVLWEIVYDEWKNSNRDGKIQLDEQAIAPGCNFLNAYHNIPVLQEYVKMKEIEIREIATGLRKPLSAEEMQSNPLNNARNLGNTMASLAKLKEFKEKIDAK